MLNLREKMCIREYHYNLPNSMNYKWWVTHGLVAPRRRPSQTLSCFSEDLTTHTIILDTSRQDVIDFIMEIDPL